MTTHAIGKANYSSGKKNYHKVKDGDQQFRILPPFADLAKDGKWAVYESIHWGYKNSQGKHKLFQCIQVKDPNTKMVKVCCAECDSIAAKVKEREALKEKLIKEKKSNIKELLAPFDNWTQAHNNERCWYVNALNEKGEIGRLSIKHTCYQSLMVQIKDCLKRGIDPLDPAKGVWFKFSRNGVGRDTKYTVSVAKIEVNVDGEIVEKTKFGPLAEDVLNRMQTEAWNLSGMFTKLSQDQIQRLVDSGGDTSVVDSVFGSGRIDDAEGDDAEPTSEELNVATAAALQAAAEAESSATVDDEAKQLETLRAARKSKTAGMSDKEFAATFGK